MKIPKPKIIYLYPIWCSLALAPPPGDRGEERAKFVHENTAKLRELKLVAESDEIFRTLRLEPANSPKDVRADVQFDHGVAMSYSWSFSWQIPLVVMGSDISVDPNPSSTAKWLRQQPEYLPLHCEASDLPLHHLGPVGGPASSLSQLVTWRLTYMHTTPNVSKPKVLISRSASPRLTGELIHQFPGEVAAAVFISPTYPGGAARDELQRLGAKAEIAASKNPNAKLDDDKVDWFFRLTKDIRWTPGYFGKTPILILTGSEDTQVLPQDRVDLAALAAADPNVTYVDIRGAGHNVLDTSKKLQPIGREAYLHIYKFLNRVLPKP